MTKLTGLNVEFTGDAAGVEAAAKRAGAAVKGVGDQAKKTGQQQAAAAKQSGVMAGGMARLGNMSRATKANVRNVGYQVQDMAVQLSMGTDVMRTMSMQLPQLLSGFGLMGVVLGTVAGVTIPLASAAMAAFGSEVIDATKASEKLTTAVSAWKTAADDANMSNDALSKSFGGISEGLRATLQAGEQLAKSEAISAMNVAVISLADDMGYLERSFNDWMDAQNQGMADTAAGQNRLRRYEDQISKLAESLGLTGNQVKALMPQLFALAKAKGPESAATAAGDLFQITQDLGISFDDLTEAGFKFFNVVQDVAVSANKLSAPVMDAGTATGLLVDAFRVARAEMWQLEGEAPAAFAAVSDAVAAAAARVASLFSGGAPADTPDTPRRGGGGVSAAEKAKQEAQRNLERLTSRLATETETLAAGYADQKSVLQSALDAKLISQNRFEELSLRSQAGYVKSMNAIDAARRNSAVSTAGDLFGQLAGLMSSENKRLFNIGKAAAIGEAIINTYKGISQSLSAYPMPIAGVFAAAHAAIGFANVAKIKSTQFGGAGGGGGAGAVSTPAIPDSGGGNSTLVNVTLNGDNFSRSGIRGLLDNINDVIGEGGRIRLV